jgi:hypothetical protein
MKTLHARAMISLAFTLALLAWGGVARAQDVPASAPAGPPSAAGTDVRGATDRSAEGPAARPWRIGAIGGVGFPRPLAVEAMGVVGEVVGLGAEYGALPAITISGVHASLWSLAADARLFPFRGAFYIGLRGGHQHVAASTTINVGSIGSLPEDLAFDSWFINPRLGFLWTSHEGLALGVEAGVQFPISSSWSSTLPLSLAPSAQHTADTLGSAVVPTIDFFRLGLLL